MTSSFQDSVLDFDLDFLQQPSSNAEIESKLEKQKKAIFIAKKKTIATDLLIRKYYLKKDQLDQTEVKLLASKEECKQICIDNSKSAEKCTQLEKDVKSLKSKYAELEQKYKMSQNQVVAVQSHARQLQDLLKENETVIESMKIDSNLEKSILKGYKKKFSALQKKHDEALKHLYLACKIALRKKKLREHHKTILQTYVSSNDEDSECSLSGDSSEETDFCEVPSASPLYTIIEISPELEVDKEVDTKTDVNKCVKQDVRRLLDDNESDYSNGVISEDTGRGSSLAFSDSDKCVNSPDYFVTDSPPEESNNHVDRKKVTNASTSPRKNPEIVHRATSPIAFDNENLLKENGIQQSQVGHKYSITDMPLMNEIVNIIEKPQMIDVATSPVRDIEKVTIATSPIIFMDVIDTSHCTSEVPQISMTNKSNTNLELSSNENNREGDEKNDKRNRLVHKDLSSNCELDTSNSRNEKTCLKSNNEINLQEENNNDHEVEMILNSMQLRHELITPLPQTPVKSSKKKRRPLEPVVEKNNVEKHLGPDVLELREENKLLKSSIAELTKEVLNIKSILKKQLIMPESPKKSPIKRLVNTESLETTLFDASQESIIIVCGNDDRGTTIRNEESVVNSDIGVSMVGPSEVTNGRLPGKDIEKPLDTNEQLSPSLTNNNQTDFVLIDPPHSSSEPQTTECIQTTQFSPRLTTCKEVDFVPIASGHTSSEPQTTECMQTTQFSPRLTTCNEVDFVPIASGHTSSEPQTTECMQTTQFSPRLTTCNEVDFVPIASGHTSSKPQTTECIQTTQFSPRLTTSNEVDFVPIASGHTSSEPQTTECMQTTQFSPRLTTCNEVDFVPIASGHTSSEPQTTECMQTTQFSPRLTICNEVDFVPIASGHTSSEPQTTECMQTNQHSPHITTCNEVDFVSMATPHNLPESLPTEFERNKQIKNSVNESAEMNAPEKRSQNFNVLENDLDSEENIVPIYRNEDDEDRCPNTIQKIGKPKKLSKLDRFKRRLIPKSKIKFKALPTPQRRKCKIIPVNKLNLSDKGLNNKIAYEKAIKVMKELKLKQDSAKKDINSITKKVENKAVGKLDMEKTEVHKKDDVDFLCKNKIESKKFVLRLPRLNIEKHFQSVKQSEIRDIQRNKSNCSEFSKPDNQKHDTNEADIDSSPTVRTTRSKSKMSKQNDVIPNLKSPRKVTDEEANEIIKKYDRTERVRRLKRVASNNSDVSCKRILRSSTRDSRTSTEDDLTLSELCSPRRKRKCTILTKPVENSFREHGINKINSNTVNSSEEIHTINNMDVVSRNSVQECHPSQSILCKMIDKYSRYTETKTPKKISENITNQIYKKLETDITNITKKNVNEIKPAINKLAKEIKELNVKYFMAGLMKYLKDPSRKLELFSKVASALSPSMTKSELVLLYVLKQLHIEGSDIVNLVLTHIDFSLFHLNKTPEFDVIESLSHFYALICCGFRLRTRLRQFLMDAMYCLQFKVVPIIKQCLDVWMQILPLAHMGIAKSSLVTCLVYLLHFYKCEDRYNRIQEIRMILNKKYFYKMSDWNESKMLEIFRTCLIEIKENSLEKRMLRWAFVILAKRQGPQWCQKNIIKNMLIPLIETEDVSPLTKKFCLSLIGPLLKPYPKEMKINCEIVVNYLQDKLDRNPQDDMKEAILTSLIYMNKHNHNRVTEALLSWSPKQTSEDFEELMLDFIREKPVKVWRSIMYKHWKHQNLSLY